MAAPAFPFTFPFTSIPGAGIVGASTSNTSNTSNSGPQFPSSKLDTEKRGKPTDKPMIKLDGVPALEPYDYLNYLGCLGMTRDEYDSYRLNSAPFLSYYFQAKSTKEMHERIIQLISDLPIPNNEGVLVPSESLQKVSGDDLNTKEVLAANNASDTTSLIPEYNANNNNNDSFSIIPEYNTVPEYNVQTTYTNNTSSVGQEKPKIPVHDRLGITDPRRCYGPAYLILATDKFTFSLECYLYFPSMTKDARPWPSYHYFGACHRWMYRMLYSPKYHFMRPRGNCFRTAPDFVIPTGCTATSGYWCVQSKRTHKKMRIYRKAKKIQAYPAAYFSAFRLNIEHPQLKQYFNPNSFTHVQRNVLPADMEMFVGCRYMLISENRKYFYVLGRSTLTLYLNTGSLDIVTLCLMGMIPSAFMVPQKIHSWFGGYSTRMAIEGTTLNIYTTYYPNGSEYPVYSINIGSEKAVLPIAIVLDNDGELQVYDRNNEAVGTVNLKGSTMFGEYDPDADYRQRLINLIAYLKLVNRYKETPVYDPNAGEAVPLQAPDIIYQEVPLYDSSVDYVGRLTQLIDVLRNNGKLTREDPLFHGKYQPPTPEVIVPEIVVSPEVAVLKNPSLAATVPTMSSGNSLGDIFRTGFDFDMAELERKSGMVMKVPTNPTGVSSGDNENDPPDPVISAETDNDAMAKIDTEEAKATFEETTQETKQALADLKTELAGLKAKETGKVQNQKEEHEGDYQGPTETGIFFGAREALMGTLQAKGTEIQSVRRPSCPLQAGAYNAIDDFYCRLMSLRTFIRSQKPSAKDEPSDDPYLRLLGDPQTMVSREVIPQAIIDTQLPPQTGIQPYDPSNDYRARIDVLTSRYPTKP